ncbi:LOB domain-containing protein 39-like [Lolium rigidum]|uniref:LOB domain-containing protein 39-like n=1 Tax=Lolium rigidum TaxID=89674 RepID=UPI001F5C2769|nr:LOB domain-containing protein 39-like [Lolium rigidum]
MSCNGCRVLRKGCSDACVLRPSIEWIDGAQPQANATVFVAKFFGRAGLVASLAAVPLHHRQALFRSLLYEACGRTINPVSGAIGLMWTSNWDLCQAAADAVLRGESLRALSAVPAAFTDRDMAGLYGNVGTNTGSSSSLHSSPENSSSAPSRKRSKNNCGVGVAQQQQINLMPPMLQSCELDLCLTPVSPLGGERRCGGGGASDEYSTTTCCEQEASGDAEAGAPALLNLFS